MEKINTLKRILLKHLIGKCIFFFAILYGPYFLLGREIHPSDSVMFYPVLILLFFGEGVLFLIFGIDRSRDTDKQ